MAKIGARGATELFRYRDVKSGVMYLVRSDGKLLRKLTSHTGWHIAATIDDVLRHRSIVESRPQYYRIII